MNNKKILIVGLITLLVMVGVISGAFAYFIFVNTTENQVLVAGDVFMKYTESNTVINAELMMPRSSYDPETYFEFTIEGKNTYSKDIYYEILINHGEEHETRKTRLDDKFLRFRLEEIVGDEVTPVIEDGTYEEIDNTKIWVNTIASNTKTKTSIKYRLYMWITDEVSIGDIEGADYSSKVWNNDVFASIKVSVNGDFEEKSVGISLYKTIKEKINDSNSITDTDGTIYLSGSNETINFNYIWYSGKLWRIVAINPDETIKIITQDLMGSLHWNETSTYEGSWIYQWLNEDFLSTLYNYEETIVEDASWNSSYLGTTPKKPPITGKIVNGAVGLLNTYEYYQSYLKLGTTSDAYKNGYLNIGYYWKLITPCESKNMIQIVDTNGYHNACQSSLSSASPRPVVNLKSKVLITDVGDGSKDNPYRIKVDKEIGKANEKVNTRLSGEYVKVDDKIYRIINVEDNGTTKLISTDYVRDEKNNILRKSYSYILNDTSWEHSVNGNDSWWGYYLNNVWLTDNLKKYITEGTYYLGTVSTYSSKGNYKIAICLEEDINETTKNCTKTSSTWTGLVGLPRVGEMFSAILGGGSNDTLQNLWLITPATTNTSSYQVFRANYDGGLTTVQPYDLQATRPTIFLKSEVIITSGDGMSPDTAYTIGLPE